MTPNRKVLNDRETRVHEQIMQLGTICRSMLSEVMSAYEQVDERQARETAVRDDRLDRLEKDLVTDIIAWMRKHPNDLLPCTRTLWVAHHIERIGDRVTNIAERVVYMVNGSKVDLNA